MIVASLFFLIGKIKEDFQIVGNIPLLRDNLNILVKSSVRINLLLYKKTEGIPSGPGLVPTLKLEIKDIKFCEGDGINI